MRRTAWACLVLAAVALGPMLARAELVSRRFGRPAAAATTAKGAGPVRASGAAVPVGYAVPADAAPAIDGKLDDACWQAAPVMKLARLLDNSAAAPQVAEVRAVQDAKTLYLAFRCPEPAMDKLKVAKQGHDAEVWVEDSVEVFLGSGEVYYHLGVSAGGATYDGKGKDSSWNCPGLKAAAQRGDKEWTAEMAIPLEKLFAKLPTDWIANFNRNRQAGGEAQESAWSPTNSGNSHQPEMFGKLVFGPAPKEAAPAGAAAVGEGVKVIPVKDGVAIVQFDLSALPKDAKIYRADLLVQRTKPVTGNDDEAMVDPELYPLFEDVKASADPKPGGDALKIAAPWFDRFDATDAVKQWVAGKPNGGVYIKACPFIDPAGTTLEVYYEGKADKPPRQVSDVKAIHRAGQTFITWKEIEEPVGADEVKWGQLRSIIDNLDQARRIRYCVYRSDKPITAATLAGAEQIAQVAPLSCWNVNGRGVDKPIDHMLGTQYALMHGAWNPFVGADADGKFGVDCLMERLVIEDGKEPLPRGTGLYVHTTGCMPPGKAHYAVVTSIDGVVNGSEISDKNAAAVDEMGGTGEPVLQKVFPPQPYFNYRETRLHYVTWVNPPLCNVPSQYYNWGVGVPEEDRSKVEDRGSKQDSSLRPSTSDLRPLELSLHRDGRSYYRTQFRVEQNSLVVSPHDFPVKSWWYGYHESYGTLKSFKQGTVQPYTERRLLAFIDWAARKWPVDRSRVFVAGPGGGGAGGGALHLAMRHPKVFSLCLSGYGASDYAGEMTALAAVKRLGTMGTQLEGIWGKVAWACKADSGQSVWDDLNCNKLAAESDLKVEFPLITMCGHGLLQPLRDFFLVMGEKRQPIMGRYGVYGGGLLVPVSRTGNWSGMIREDVALSQSLPAFRGGAFNALTGEPREPSGNLVVSDGIKRWWGEINTGYRWRTDDIVDEPTRYEITISWAGSAKEKPAADVTIRRLLKFQVRPNYEYSYQVMKLVKPAETKDAAKEDAKGQPVADVKPVVAESTMPPTAPAWEKADEGKVNSGPAGVITVPGVAITPEGVRLIIKP